MANDAQQKDPQQQVETYMSRLRGGLRGLKHDEIREIVEELRSHIADKASEEGKATNARVGAALAALGSPEELAREYVTDALLARAEASRWPLEILKSLFRWASLSVAGFFAFLATILGYSAGMVFFLVAALKPFHPENAGLWVWRESGHIIYSVRLGFGTPPPGARELLGWWILPIGLVVSCAVVVLTTHFAIWCVRQYRRSRPLRHG